MMTGNLDCYGVSSIRRVVVHITNLRHYILWAVIQALSPEGEYNNCQLDLNVIHKPTRERSNDGHTYSTTGSRSAGYHWRRCFDVLCNSLGARPKQNGRRQLRSLVTIGVVSSNSLPSDYFPPASSFYSWQYIGLSWRTAPPHTTRQAL